VAGAPRWPTTCERTTRTGVGAWAPSHRCQRPVRYVFEGVTAGQPRRVALCVQHSGPGYLSEGALPGWVKSVRDLRADD
jgi:hypothetical protein